jgi:hypothetical protein
MPAVPVLLREPILPAARFSAEITAPAEKPGGERQK